MNINFICGSLEPGRDGVGDYTRRLAGELIKQGHSACMLAFNDPHVQTEIEAKQNSSVEAIQVYRLPATLSQKMRFEKARQWIEKQNTTWLSLQYVPYSFHEKGLPIGLATNLENLCKGCNWHIMFHELWIGMNLNATLKEKAIGTIQKRIVKSLIKHLKPNIIHTQTQLYITQLNKIGISATHLPLFSNIPVTATSNSVKSTNINAKKTLGMVLFGGIHPNLLVDDFLLEVVQYSKKTNKTLQLITIGRNGSEINHWLNTCSAYKIDINALGEQSEDTISSVLSKADLGLTTTPFALVEKSGSIAAMQAHNLPVICVDREWDTTKESLKNPLQVMHYKKGNLEQCINQASHVPKIDRTLKNIAQNFVGSLQINIENGES